MADRPVEVIVSDGEVTQEVADALARRVSVEPREYVIFIHNTIVPSRSKVLVETYPLSADSFKTRILVIPSTIGEHFLVHDIMVEGRSQILANAAGIPATLFSEKTSLPSTFRDLDSTVDFDVCPVNGKLSVVVENMSSEPQKFLGCFVGSIVG
jgi:hypothetical protein